jgi:hypothetical protein
MPGQITEFSGTVPALNQTQPEFDQNTQDFIDYMANLAPELNEFAEELNSLSTTTASTSSVAIGTGTKNFTVETGKSLFVGMSYKMAYDANNWMLGDIISYNSGTGALSIDVDTVRGSGTYSAWVGTLSFNGQIETTQLANAIFNDLSEAEPADADYLAGADTGASGAKIKFLLSKLFTTPVSRPVPVRQTVLSGPVDSNGLPNFGGATSGTSVTMTGTIVATAANGSLNRTGSGTNLQWTGLSTNGTMYLYVDVNADGTLTTGSGTLAPNYRWGGADVTTNGQFTFNIQEMSGKVGNGSAATQTYRVYVGEVTVAGNVVTAITWYALNGKYISPDQAIPANGTAASVSHNLGINTPYTSLLLYLKNSTTDLSYAVNDCIPLNDADSGTNVATASVARMTAQVNGNYTSIGLANKSTGSRAGITAANWRFVFHVTRDW